MPVTVRGTDILFNDGSTQAFGLQGPSAGSLVLSFSFTNIQTSSTSYVLTSQGYSFLTGGSIRARMRVLRGVSDYGATTAGYARPFINGSAVGSEFSAGAAQNNFTFSEQDLTVNAGDLLQLGVRSSSTAAQPQGALFILGSNRRQAPVCAFLNVNNPF